MNLNQALWAFSLRYTLFASLLILILIYVAAADNRSITNTAILRCQGYESAMTEEIFRYVTFALSRDYNELCKTEGEHPPTVSNLPFPWHVMTSAPFQATPLPDLDMDAFRAHL